MLPFSCNLSLDVLINDRCTLFHFIQTCLKNQPLEIDDLGFGGKDEAMVAELMPSFTNLS